MASSDPLSAPRSSGVLPERRASAAARVFAALPAAAALLFSSAAAQPYTVGRAVDEAARRYPAVTVASEQFLAAAAAIRLARTAYQPRLELNAQANRATRNNVFGMLLPPAVVPAISGPPLASNDMTSVWGSATGMQISWEPFDFGFRRAAVAKADASSHRAAAALERARFEVSVAAADSFLTLLAAEQTLAAARAGVQRAAALRQIAEGLVKAQLRPGADLSRAAAELAAAENQQIQAEQAVKTANATLMQFLASGAAGIEVDGSLALRTPPDDASPAEPEAPHPRLKEQQAAIAESEAARQAAIKSYAPKFYLTAAAYARGTGALPDGATLSGLSGLGPNIFNWGIAAGVSFPLSDLPAWKARKESALHHELAERARERQIRQELGAARARAQAALEGARRIAANAPVLLRAARDAEAQAVARYRAGLGTLAEVAEAQRLLVAAETDEALARLQMWRALLHAWAAAGDLQPFLKAAGE